MNHSRTSISYWIVIKPGRQLPLIVVHHIQPHNRVRLVLKPIVDASEADDQLQLLSNAAASHSQTV